VPLQVAATDSDVLISGETGTDKELAAELIHRNSPRHDKPFICINCAALPEGLLKSEPFGFYKGAFVGTNCAYPGKLKLAEGGTVFFDEIGDMSPYAQASIYLFSHTADVPGAILTNGKESCLTGSYLIWRDRFPDLPRSSNSRTSL
jgi:DNA-binding NtrC family response regulator